MKRFTLFIFLLFSSSSLSDAATIQLFNVEVLDTSVSANVKLLNDIKASEIEPKAVLVDIHKGKYKAATVTYSKEEVSFEDAKKSINNSIKKAETVKFTNFSTISMLSWRFENKKYTISLVLNDESDKDIMKILYIKFTPWE